MRELAPVLYKGIEYQKINAYIYRIYVNPHTRKYKETFQLELQDKRGNSITIANANAVTLLAK